MGDIVPGDQGLLREFQLVEAFRHRDTGGASTCPRVNPCASTWVRRRGQSVHRHGPFEPSHVPISPHSRKDHRPRCQKDSNRRLRPTFSTELAIRQLVLEQSRSRFARWRRSGATVLETDNRRLVNLDRAAWISRSGRSSRQTRHPQWRGFRFRDCGRPRSPRLEVLPYRSRHRS